jgi:4-hydroxy-tetrahydrodipicolinate reductase
VGLSFKRHARHAGKSKHTVIFGGIGERLEFIHRAHSRDTFARGALRAVRWLAKRKPGLYGMLDVLGI